MEKKAIIACLCLVLLLTFSAGCGSQNDNKETDTATITNLTESSAELSKNNDMEVSTEKGDINEVPEKYAYSLIIVINPEVELYFDEKDTIIGMEYHNDDAINAYKELEIIGKTIDEGMVLIIESSIEKGYLKADGQVSVELAKVMDEEQVKDSAMLSEAQRIIENYTVTKFEQPVTINIKVDETVSNKTGIVSRKICGTCGGKGVYCSECLGVLIVNCKRCVNGIESCGTCKGTAIINCHGCKGSGSVNGNETCNYCGGSGKISCDACHGAGTFLCSWCKGELKHICPICFGEPSECTSCNGSGYEE